MKQYRVKFEVDMIDQSMSPLIEVGDLVTVCPGFEVENGHMVAVLITDEKEQTTKLHIRKVIFENGKIILKAQNRKFPSFVYEGQNKDNVRLIGIVTGSSRFLYKPLSSRQIITAKFAQQNRIVLENQSGNLVLNGINELEEVR